MWVGVTSRFRAFHAACVLTQDELEDGVGKQFRVRQCLHRAYWSENDERPAGFMVGSWGKGTVARPPQDIDVFFELSDAVAARFSRHQGNAPSALLQEVKNILAKTYPQTNLRGDGQVVVVGFNTLTVEIVPAFRHPNGHQFIMGDTNGGGSWKVVDPFAEIASVESVDTACNRNFRPLIQMVKIWKREQTVPVKSFWIELLMAEYLICSPWRLQSYFYYDWLVRDFFAFLLGKANGIVTVPGTGEQIAIGSVWKAKAQKALEVAQTACEFEREDKVGGREAVDGMRRSKDRYGADVGETGSGEPGARTALRARSNDVDLIHELPYGPAACEPPQ